MATEQYMCRFPLCCGKVSTSCGANRGHSAMENETAAQKPSLAQGRPGPGDRTSTGLPAALHRALTSAQLLLQKVWTVELTSFRDCWLVRFRKWKV